MSRLLLPILGVTVSTLAACGSNDQARSFGASRSGLEDVRNTAPPALSVPPVLARRPPRGGSSSSDSAFSEGDVGLTPPSSLSPGQEALVAGAGPPSPTNIRQRVDQDAQIRRPNSGLTEQLLFGGPETPQVAGDNSRMIKQEGKSWLGDIF